MRNVPINISTASFLIEEGSKTFLTAYKECSPEHSSEEEGSSVILSVVSAFEAGNYGMRFQDEVHVPSGMAQILQNFCSLLEGLHSILSELKKIEKSSEKSSDKKADKTNKNVLKNNENDGNERSDIYSLRIIIGCLLNVFKCLNDPLLKALLSVEYAKTLIADNAYYCLNSAGGLLGKTTSNTTLIGSEVEKLSKGDKSEKSKKDKKKLKESESENENNNENNLNIFNQNRIAKDVEQVLLCLGTARSLQVQKASLQLLRSLIILSPESVMLSVGVLGSLLSSPSISQQLLRDSVSDEKDGLVGDILSTLVSALPQSLPQGGDVEVQNVKSYNFLPQDILQPFCAR